MLQMEHDGHLRDATGAEVLTSLTAYRPLGVDCDLHQPFDVAICPFNARPLFGGDGAFRSAYCGFTTPVPKFARCCQPSLSSYLGSIRQVIALANRSHPGGSKPESYVNFSA